MGNDTTLRIKPANGGRSVCLRERASGGALLWLCCFRLWDFKYYMELRCPVDDAIGQLEYGVMKLEEVFGEIAYLKENQLSLTAELENHRGAVLLMDFHDAFGENETGVGLLVHCLTGFWNSDSKVFFDEAQRAAWDLGYGWAPPGESGIMTWAGALQRLCIPCPSYPDFLKVAATLYDRKGAEAFDWEVYNNHDPRVYLIGS